MVYNEADNTDYNTLLNRVYNNALNECIMGDII